MPGALSKLLRLAIARGPFVVLRAALGAAADTCRVRRFRVVATPTAHCGWRSTWRLPTRQRFLPALQRRLGLPRPDFRRRAESTEGLDDCPPEVQVEASLLLAGTRALDDARVQTFLLAQASEGVLRVVHPGEPIVPLPGTVTLLAGIEANADGRNCLLALRHRGFGCEWLSAEHEATPAEVPLREACLRQAVPAEDATRLFHADIAVAPAPTFHRHATPTRQFPLRILTYRWHVPHQYELFKLGAEFTLASDLGEDACRWWDLGQRPMPGNARFACWSQVDPRQFDLAILHFDENVLRPTMDARGIGTDWGASFRFLRQNLAIPCVAVCHGTPAADAPEQLQALVEFIGDLPVVVNSHQALAEWGYRNARVIWQGFDPAEFPLRPVPGLHTPRILTLPGEATAERPGHRGASLLEAVAEKLATPLEPLRVAEPNLLLAGNAYAKARFARYVAALHAYDIYFNPTLRSPMPRTRGEAMLCGLATVNADSHDVDCFIENGKNGFYAASTDELAEQLGYLLADQARAWRIGQAGRTTASRLFHIDRYLDDWRQLIRDTLGNDAI